MNPVPRPMVFSAATILAGVCVLGLYLGIHDSLGHPVSGEGTAPTSSAAAASTPSVGVAAAIEAKPLASDLPESAAPAKLAEAKPKARPADEDEDQAQADATIPASDVLPTQAHAPPEPPPLYPPPGEPANPPPANDNNAPPY